MAEERIITLRIALVGAEKLHAAAALAVTVEPVLLDEDTVDEDGYAAALKLKEAASSDALLLSLEGRGHLYEEAEITADDSYNSSFYPYPHNGPNARDIVQDLERLAVEMQRRGADWSHVEAVSRAAYDLEGVVGVHPSPVHAEPPAHPAHVIEDDGALPF